MFYLIFTTALLFVTSIAVPTGTFRRDPVYYNTTGNRPANDKEINQPSPSPRPYGGSHRSDYHSPAWVPHGQVLSPHLPQEKTNGHSKLGTSDAPKLPHYIGGSESKPWGGRTAKQTNFYKDIPNTGVTRQYDFTIAEQEIAPDGVTRNGMVVNGAFPGPTIEANWGDWIEVTVHNNLQSEGTSLHWHGLLQQDTPWFDGVPSVMQCPIAPGSTFTYKFRADLYGSSFWHSHFSAQYTDGIFGAMIIYGPSDNVEYDTDLGPVLLTDYYHQDYYSLVEQVMAPASEQLLPPVSNNNLINGKMQYPCASAAGLPCTSNAGISKFYFESGKTYRLRLINGGAEGIQKFSIDGHKLTVFANDFVPLVPYETDVVTLGIGQRTDVIVKATGEPTDTVWMRSTLGKSAFEGGCTLNDGISPEAVAAIYYEKADTTTVPTTTSSISEDVINTCENDALTQTVPFFSLTPPSPETTQEVAITFQSNGTHNLFYMNNSTFRADYNDPLLLEAKLGHTEFAAQSNVYNFGNSRSIRLVVYNHATTGAHPMHMHGHNMYILAEGTGTWDGSVTNGQNPQRRDVHLLPNAVSDTEPAYIVVQIDADNPGVWPFHCHIAWHVSAGLYINLLERPNEIKNDMQIPSISAQTCRDWAAWTGTNIPNEIDSGL